MKTIQDLERENEELKRMNAKLKEQLTRALEAVAKMSRPAGVRRVA